MADGKVVFEYVGDTAGIDKANQEAEGKFSSLGAIGAKALAAIGAAAVAAGAAVVKLGSDFESAFAGVIKTVDATEEELAALRKGILEMSYEVPAAANEIAGVAESAGQLGVETDNVLGFTRAMIDLGESTNMSAGQAATSLARLANITGLPQTEFDKLGSAVVWLGNNLATTESEIVEFGFRLAGAGSQAGMTEADILAVGAALSGVGINAEAGGSAFSKVINDINMSTKTGGKALEQYAYVAGMSADEFAKAFKVDAANAVALFVEGLGSLEERGGDTILMLEEMGITEVRMRDSLLRASGASDIFRDALTGSNTAFEENTALTKEAGQRYATLESQWGMMKNQVSGLAIALYDDMRPALGEAVQGIRDFLTAFAESDELKEFSKTLGELAGVLAGTLLVLLPVLVDLINAVVPPVSGVLAAIVPLVAEIAGKLVPVIAQWIDTIMPLLPVLVELALDVILPLVDQVAALAEAIIPLVAEILPPLIDLFSAIMPVVTELIDMLLPPLVDLFTNLITPLAELIQRVLPILIKYVESLLPPFFELVEALLPPLIKLFDALTPIIDSVFGSIDPLLELILILTGFMATFFIPAIIWLSEVFGDTLLGAIEAVVPWVSAIMDVFNGLLNFITGVFTGDWDRAWSGIVDMFRGIINLVPRYAESAINGAISVINGLTSGINKITGLVGLPSIGKIGRVSLPRLRVGMDYVPDDDFLALLHKGEAVLTAEEADAWRAMQSGVAVAGALQSSVAPQTVTTYGGNTSFEYVFNSPKALGVREVRQQMVIAEQRQRLEVL